MRPTCRCEGYPRWEVDLPPTGSGRVLGYPLAVGKRDEDVGMVAEVCELPVPEEIIVPRAALALIDGFPKCREVGVFVGEAVSVHGAGSVQ